MNKPPKKEDVLSPYVRERIRRLAPEHDWDPTEVEAFLAKVFEEEPPKAPVKGH